MKLDTVRNWLRKAAQRSAAVNHILVCDLQLTWYAASGRIFRTTPAGNSETELGREIDLVAYMMAKEKLRLEAGYSRFFPGEYVEENFPAATDDSEFLYLQGGVTF